MPFLTQQRFPVLWRLFQWTIGGTIDKRAICLKWYEGQKRILEVGCSVGNIAPAFASQPGAQYTGIDIDPGAIRLAQRTFAGRSNCRFICDDLRRFAETGERFDYIAFPAMCHHVDDALCISLLETASRMLAENGIIVVADPLLPKSSDPWLVKAFFRLEQGQHMRDDDAMEALLRCAEPLRLVKSEKIYMAATPFSVPRSARFGMYMLIAAGPS